MTNARQARTAREKSAALQAEAAQSASRRRVLGIAGAVIAAIIVIVGATVLIRTAQQEAEVATAVATPANTTDGAFIDGQATAPVTIRIYADYICPYCAKFESDNQAQISAWVADGTAKVEYKPIALLDQASTDGYSTRATNAAWVVADTTPSAFAKYHTLLFQQQPKEGGPGLTDDQLVQLAVQAGAPEATVRPGIEAKKFAGFVTKTSKDATSGPDKVTGTPTVMVNGEIVKDWTPAKFKETVEAAAAK
jgi:protein-disulfide isomerase